MKKLSDFTEQKMLLAKKYNITLEQVEDITQHQFSWLTDSIKDLKFHRFLLHDFGTFEVDPFKVKYQILKQIRNYKNEYITREECVERVSKLLKLRNKPPKYEWKKPRVYSNIQFI